MTLLLGIDIGTSSAKAVLFDSETAAIVATAGQEYPIHTPAPDRAEQDPDDWWRATVHIVRQAAAKVDPARIAAISFSGQMHGTILLDMNGKPLHPAIIWADQRSTATSEEMIASVGTERYVSIAGTLPAVGFLGPTLLWLRHHEPALLDAARHVVLPKDYVRLQLTGEIATDVTDAAATGLFDITRRTWSSELIASAQLPPSIFPVIIESAQAAGVLRPSAAAELGLTAGIPIIAGCADQPAQAIANGLIAPGAASVTTGTGGQVLTALRPAPGSPVPTDSRLHVFNHALPDTWYVLGAILSAGLSLRWLRGITGLDGRTDAYGLLSAEAVTITPGANGLIFLPYLLGERTPLMDSLARGSFFGLSYHHQRGHLARAIMEGVAFALRQALEISLELGGKIDTIIASGGGAESETWRQIQADVFGIPLRKSLLIEQAGLGAALLAGTGAGIFDSLEAACAHTVRLSAPTEPNMAHHAVYNELYQQFCDLYPLLRSAMHWSAGFASNR